MLPHGGPVKHTALVRGSFCVLLLSASCALSACGEPKSGGASSSADAGKNATKTEEQSPNARILPEPLENGVRAPDDDDPADKSPPTVEPREPARPFPVNQPLASDILKRGAAAGLEMEFQITWPEVKRSVQVGAEQIDTWPRFQVQLLREIPTRAARMRWVLHSRAFPFPETTEIRARADRIGHLVLWPDHRSYRIAPTGSLHALFADRRVDRVPFVEPERVTKGIGARLGKPTNTATIVTPLGATTLEFVEVTDLPYASQLLCTAFLEIVRVKASLDLCPIGQLPVHFESKWLSGDGVQFSVLSWGTANFEQEDFRMPPDLPIHKPGELPPFEDYFLDERTRSLLLPLTREKAPPLPPPPAAPGALAPGQAAPPSTPTPAPPRNQVVLRNKLSRPLVLMVNRVPYVWLSPGAVTELYLTSADVKVSARDFLGERMFAERTLTAPAELEFEEAEVAALGAPEGRGPL
jgi:hypothetical protein